MTISQLFDTTEGGNGTIDYKLVIEGFDYAFVTNQDMADLSSTPKKVNGLLKTGLKISQEVKFPDCKLSIGNNNFTIIDYQEQATKAFYRKPTFTCYLREDMSTTDTVITVSNTTGLTSGSYLWIGSECLLVLGIMVGMTDKLIVQRGALHSTPQAHYVLSNLGTPVYPILQNVPFTIERRRAYLYAYGEGDDIRGEGTLILRGLILTQPMFQGTKYSFDVGPITELLKSEIGVDSDDMKLRGIYFGAYDWTIAVQKLATADYTYNGGFTIDINGFYENKFDLAKQIDTLLKDAATDMGWTTATLGCSVMANGELVITQQHSSTTYFANIITVNYPVGAFLDPVLRTYFRIENTDYYKISQGIVNQSSKTIYSNLTVNTTYANVLEARYFPSQFTTYTKNQPTTSAQFQISVNPNQDPNSSKRLYFASSLNTFINDILVYDSTGKKIGSVHLDTNRIPVDINIYKNLNYIEPTLDFSSTTDPYLNIGFVVVDNNYKFTLVATFGQTSTNQVANNVVDFLSLLVTETPLNTDNGLTPLVTNEDIDLTDMRSEFDQLMLKAFQTNRKYIFIKKSKKLEDILAEEFKLIGAFPAMTYDGKLTIKKLRNINPFEEADYTLDSDDILTDNSYPTIETNKYGIWNAVVIRNGYNPITEKYDGDSYVQNNLQSIAVYGRSKQVEIAPISTDQYTQQSLSPDIITDFEGVLYNMTSLFSKDYWVVTVDVPMKYFNINLGSTIRIKNKQLPNYAPAFSYLTSRRGSSRILGRVVGKSFDLDKGFGSLQILVSDQEYTGTEPNIKCIYAPDALITGSRSNLGSGNWGFNIDANYSYMPSGQTQEDFWNVGDAVRFDKWDSTSADTGYGTVVAVSNGSGNAASLVVNFTSGVVPTNFSTSSVQYTMKVMDFNYVDLQDSQKIYAFYDSGTKDADNVNSPGIFNRVLGF